MLALPLFALFSAPGLAQVTPAIEWSATYLADRLPDEIGWGASKGANTSAEITPDGLRIMDAGTQNTQLHCYSRQWGARPDRGAAAQAVVRVVSCQSEAGMCLMVADGVHEDCLTLYPDRIVLEGCSFAYPMDTTDAFHTYLLRIAGTNIELWVDGKLVYDGWGKFLRPAYHGRCVVQFGSISSASTAEAFWKEVRYTTNLIPVKRVEGARDVVIYRKEGIYACFPSLTVGADGRLLTGFGTRVKRSHIDATGGCARAVSADGGETWELTDQSFPDPRHIREDGTTIVPYAQGWIEVDEKELPRIKEQGRTWMNVREGTVAYLGDPRVRITKPDGTSRTLELPPPTPCGVMCFNSSAFLHSGKVWLEAIYGAHAPDGRDAVWGILSQDDGETWQVVPLAMPLPDGTGFNETALCDNGRGEIIAVMRPDPESRNSHQCFSRDGGRTWSRPEDAGFWGYPSNVIRLQDGRLLCTYGYRREQMGIRAVLSSDGGHTWDVANEIVIRNDGQGNGGDNGYPLSVQLPDGHIFTIYYLNDAQNVTHVAGTHWRAW